jgi:hypothetical protein
LQQIIPGVQDFAQAMGVDLNTAAQLIGKTIGSSTNALSRYGIEVDASASESEKLAQIVEELDSKFGGAAAAAADSATGALVQYENAVGDLQEAVGGLVANAMQPLVESATQVATNLTEVITGFETLQDVLAFDASIENIIPGYNELPDAEARVEAINQQLEILTGQRTNTDNLGAFSDAFADTSQTAEEARDTLGEFYGEARDGAAELELLASSGQVTAEQIQILESELMRLNAELESDAGDHYLEWLNRAREIVADSPAEQLRSQIADLEGQLEQLQALNWAESNVYQIGITEQASELLREEIAKLQAQLLAMGDAGNGVGSDLEIVSHAAENAAETIQSMNAPIITATENTKELKETVEDTRDAFERLVDTVNERASGEWAAAYANIQQQAQNVLDIHSGLNEYLGGTFSDTLSAIGDLQQNRFDAEISALEKVRDSYEKNSEGYRAAQREINEARKEQFRKEKAAAIAQALINGAVAVTKALASLGPIAGGIAAGGIAALTAVQVGAIASQEVPLAAGGIVTGPTRALIGEQGPEAVIPLSKMGGMGGNTYVNAPQITVQGSMIHERQLIRYISGGQAKMSRGY